MFKRVLAKNQVGLTQQSCRKVVYSPRTLENDQAMLVVGGVYPGLAYKFSCVFHCSILLLGGNFKEMLNSGVKKGKFYSNVFSQLKKRGVLTCL